MSPSVQIGLAIGTNFNDQKFSFDNKVEQRGTYVMPELIWRAQGNFYLSLHGYCNDGEVKTHRSYRNAGMPDTSSGKTDVATYGGRVRVDWLDAFHILDTSLTPNISYSYTKTKIDSYTETKGGFPVAWDAQSETSNIARQGLDAVRPVTPSVNLLARVEGAYRFDTKGDDVSGQIIGLNRFKLSGRDHDQLWARGGIGAEANLEHGTASFMVNGTTANGNPDYWLSATYRIKF